MKRLAVVLVASVFVLGIGSQVSADEKKTTKASAGASEKAEAKTAQSKPTTKKIEKKETTKSDAESNAGRLPRHFASLVDDAQREKIYVTQEKYREKIAALRKQIEELEAEQLAECESVLTAAQRKELQALRDAGSKGEKPAVAKEPAPKKKAS